MNELIAGIVAGTFALVGTVVGWFLHERAQRKQIRSQKLQELIQIIHRVNLQVLRHTGRCQSPEAEQAMENSINEIEAVVALYFPEFRSLSERLGQAFVKTTIGESHALISSELRGLEQDLLTAWQSGEAAKYLLSPDRKLPKL